MDHGASSRSPRRQPRALPSTMEDALRSIAGSDWVKQETCYLTMMKLLDNIISHPGEEKFRRLKTSNAALRAKVFDVPGALEFLQAAGFSEVAGGDGVVALAQDREAALPGIREALQKH